MIIEFPQPAPSFFHHLFKDVLLSHQFLSLSVGFCHGDIQHRLSAVDGVSDEENYVL